MTEKPTSPDIEIRSITEGGGDLGLVFEQMEKVVEAGGVSAGVTYLDQLTDEHSPVSHHTMRELDGELKQLAESTGQLREYYKAEWALFNIREKVRRG